MLIMSSANTNNKSREEEISDIEKKALDNLLSCSKRPEKLQKSVSTKDWDAVSIWSNARPMCYYVEHAVVPKKKEKKKTKAKENINQNHGNTNKFQDSKNYFSKEKCKHFEIPLIKEVLSDDYSKNSNAIVHNKFSRSTNVLSYETPSWRFLVDSNDFNYVERPAPKEKVCNFLKRTKSLGIKNPSISKPSKPQILDPAGFLDEQIMVAYKSYRTFQPNLEIRQLLKKIDNINRQIKHNQIEERLYVTSFIKKLSPIYDGESDGNEETAQKKSAKTSSKRKKKKAKKKVKKKPTSGARNLNPQKVVLPKIDTTISSDKAPLVVKENIKNNKGTSKEELYLPLFNHSNYTNKLQYLKRPDVKLPAVAGIKISLSATSNSGLVS